MERPTRQIVTLKDDLFVGYPSGAEGKRIQLAINWIEYLEARVAALDEYKKEMTEKQERGLAIIGTATTDPESAKQELAALFGSWEETP